MQKLAVTSPITGVLLALMLLAAPVLPVHAEDSYAFKKQLRYQFLVENKSAYAIGNAVFQVMVPVKQTPTQRVDNIHSNFNYELVNDKAGNQLLKFNFKSMPAFNKNIVHIEVDIAMAEKPGESFVAEQDYLKTEPFIQVQDKMIQSLAQQIAAKATQEKMALPRATYNWLVQNLSSVEYNSEDRGALWALQNKQGDCTESMYAFIALLRAAGVQARGVAGYVVTDAPVVQLHVGTYHNWAEYRDNNAWRISDAHQKIFDSNYARYIAFHIFSHDVMQNMNYSQEFYGADARLTVRMI